MPFIRVKTGPNQGRVFEVKDDVITLGRDESQTIQILDQGVSRTHAEIFRLGGLCFVRDLNSTNGTFVNNIKVNEEALKPGDEMLIGRTILSFDERLVEDEPEPPSGLEPIDTTTRMREARSFTAGRPTQVISHEVRSRTITITHNLARALISTEDISESIQRALQMIAENIGADDGYLFMNEPSTGRLLPRASYERDEDKSERKVSKTIAKRILQTGTPLLTADAALDERLNISESVVLKKIKSVIAVPILVGGRSEGLLYFHTSRATAPFSVEDLEVVTCAALQLSIALTNGATSRRLRDQLVTAVRALVSVVDALQPRKQGHSDRVAQYGVAIAGQLGMTKEETDRVRLAGLLHDVGKIEQFGSAEPPAPEAHVIAGEKIVSAIDGYEELLPGIRYHHERADGSGFPHHIKNEETPLLARIIIVANHFDDLGMSGGSLTSSGAFPNPKDLLARMQEGAGKLFDEDVVKALLICHRNGTLYSRVTEERAV
jgi:HD-GYP domain-containing protein (c-di-GMP phosphodiesterase class II)